MDGAEISDQAFAENPHSHPYADRRTPSLGRQTGRAHPHLFRMRDRHGFSNILPAERVDFAVFEVGLGRPPSTPPTSFHPLGHHHHPASISTTKNFFGPLAERDRGRKSGNPEAWSAGSPCRAASGSPRSDSFARTKSLGLSGHRAGANLSHRSWNPRKAVSVRAAAAMEAASGKIFEIAPRLSRPFSSSRNAPERPSPPAAGSSRSAAFQIPDDAVTRGDRKHGLARPALEKIALQPRTFTSMARTIPAAARELAHFSRTELRWPQSLAINLLPLFRDKGPSTKWLASSSRTPRKVIFTAPRTSRRRFRHATRGKLPAHHAARFFP